MKKQNQGVTLIALVITIIVLLILAGVAMTVIMGDNNLFEKAQQAKEETNAQVIKEQLELQILQARLDNQGKVTSEQLKTIFQQHGTVVYESNGVTVKGVKLSNNQEILLSEVAQIKFDEKPAESITLDQTTATVDKNATITLMATILPEDATVKGVQWISSDETIATVDENGVVTGAAQGTVTITAKTTDGTNLTAQSEVTVDTMLATEAHVGDYVNYLPLANFNTTTWQVFYITNTTVLLIPRENFGNYSAQTTYQLSSLLSSGDARLLNPDYASSQRLAPYKSELDRTITSVKNCGFTYWLMDSYFGEGKNYHHLCFSTISGYTNCYGVRPTRPVITLKAGLKTSGKVNNVWQLIPQP